MIDIWMLFTMTVPFLEVIFHTTAEVLNRPRATHVVVNNRVDLVKVNSAEELEKEEMEQDEEEEPWSRKSMSSTLLSLAGRLMLPVSTLIFMVIYWIVGLVASYSANATQDPSMTNCLTTDLN